MRHDNADRRLTPLAHNAGLVCQQRMDRLRTKLGEVDRIAALLDSRRHEGVTLAQLLRRPEVEWPEVVSLAPELATTDPLAAEQALIDTKYAGYIARQQQDVDRLHRLASKRIPASFDFERLVQLRAEARQKFSRIRPIDLAQASRISGITPADIALVMAHLDAPRR